jgi:hypothetical protein
LSRTLGGLQARMQHAGCFHSDVSGVGGRHLATFEVNTVVADWDLNAHGTTSAQLRRNSGALRTQTSAVQPSRATHGLGFGFGFGWATVLGLGLGLGLGDRAVGLGLGIRATRVRVRGSRGGGKGGAGEEGLPSERVRPTFCPGARSCEPG